MSCAGRPRPPAIARPSVDWYARWSPVLIRGKDLAGSERGDCSKEVNVKRFLPSIALLSCPVAFCDEPVKVDSVQAVMYEFTYNAQTLVITHAQVIGGFPSVDLCREAMPRVAATGSVQLDAGEQMQLQCSGIRSPGATEPPASEPVVSTTKL